MKFVVGILCSLLILTSCNSGKSKIDSAGKKDSTSGKMPDSTGTNSQNDIAPPDASGWGGAGNLSLGLTGTKVTELLGKPDSTSANEMWDADGMMHQDWFYPGKGITLNMGSEKNASGQDIFSITIISPCTLRTNRNIGIGSTRAEVIAAYENEIDKPASDLKLIVIGSMYDGILVAIENDKVEQIFFGAGAE